MNSFYRILLKTIFEGLHLSTYNLLYLVFGEVCFVPFMQVLWTIFSCEKINGTLVHTIFQEEKCY